MGFSAPLAMLPVSVGASFTGVMAMATVLLASAGLPSVPSSP